MFFIGSLFSLSFSLEYIFVKIGDSKKVVDSFRDGSVVVWDYGCVGREVFFASRR